MRCDGPWRQEEGNLLLLAQAEPRRRIQAVVHAMLPNRIGRANSERRHAAGSILDQRALMKPVWKNVSQIGASRIASRGQLSVRRGPSRMWLWVALYIKGGTCPFFRSHCSKIRDPTLECW